MNNEKQKENKTTIILYCLTCLLEYGFIYPEQIKEKFNISNRTIYRYISEIKEMFSNYGFDNLEIKYEKVFESNTYRCFKNK